jgi:hypothetical protein
MRVLTLPEALLGLALATLALGQSSGQCSKCDCSRFPIKEAVCVKCCYTITGQIAASSDNQVTLVSSPSNVEKKKSFSVSPRAQITGTLKVGERATVYYHSGPAASPLSATRIDVLNAVPGTLEPASDAPQSVPGACSGLVPRNALRVLVGGMDSFTTNDSAIVLRAKDENLIWVERTENGLLFSIRVLNERGDTVAEVVNNQFFVNTNDLYTLHQSSRDSLEILEQSGAPVLSVKYIDPVTVRILGVLYTPSGQKLELTESGFILQGRNNFINVCNGGGTRVLTQID